MAAGETKITDKTKVSAAKDHILYAQWTIIEGDVHADNLITNKNEDNTSFSIQWGPGTMSPARGLAVQ